MRRKNKIAEVESGFNRKEAFDINHIPTHFDSVKASSLRKIKRSAIRQVAYDADFDAGALEMELRSIDGLFGFAYKTLEEDFDARSKNLKTAYRDGLKQVRQALKRYEFQAELHNIAFDKYNEANKIINGTELSDSLRVSKSKIEEFKNAINKLAKR